MTVEISVAISIACALLGAIIGYASHRRTARNDAKDEGRSIGVILTEIGNIKAGVDDIKRMQEKQDERYIEMSCRLTAVESSAKQAHKRIDGIQGSMDEKKHN